jgi:(4-O-methyl)-D-glucuronate---lignin esterase
LRAVASLLFCNLTKLMKPKLLNRHQFLLILSLILGGLMFASLGFAQGPPGTNYDEAKVGNYTLPDPLVFNDGTSVRTAADWTKRRRAEVLELFATNVFGHSPAPPQKLEYEVFDTDQNALNGKAIRKQITIYFSPSEDGPKEDILLYLPKEAGKPVPLFLILSFSGNQTATSETAIKLGTTWNPRTRQKSQAPEDSRGRGQADTERILARGYGYATINYVDIEPDFRGGYLSGLRRLFFKPGQVEPAPGEWGAIGAWSYGLSRALDYFEKDKDVDAKRVAIVGHSRLGKTVLWAGSIDTRFAMVISSCSGEGGASLSRRDYGERIKNLAANFPYWFNTEYQKFADNEAKLPVDMHELIALIAPRPVYITAGETDRWADPKGEFLACVAAGPVFRLLGGEDLGTDQMPALDQPIMKSLAYHIHTGGHSITPFDWEQFLKYADMKLK